MVPTSFNEENGVLDAPPGMDNCDALSVWRGMMDDGSGPVVVSCWKPTKDELEEIQRTGRVWVIVFGRTMPPLAVAGRTPFSPDSPLGEGG